MAQSLIKRQTELSGNIVLFCRFLRTKGYGLNPTEEADALQALSFFSINNEHIFKNALKAILAKNKYQQLQFDDYYREFWEQLAKAVDSKIKESPEHAENRNAKQKEPTFQSLKNWLYGKPAEDECEVASFSGMEVLGRKDFSDMDEDELRLIIGLLRKIARQLTHQKSRLKKTSNKRKFIDLKRTFRANMRRGGEIQQLLFSEKKDKKLKLVLLCDVSKSMDLYSRFFVHLIYAFQNAYDKIETFVFSTAIHRVTEILDNHEFTKAFDIISDRVPQWSGGTKIGSCLHFFMEHYGWNILNSKTVVLILSDGWDTGEPDLLKATMHRIQKSSKKVVWLNPLAGNPNFSAEVTGMKTAMPYVDVFASAHNLESLKAAMKHLKRPK